MKTFRWAVVAIVFGWSLLYGLGGAADAKELVPPTYPLPASESTAATPLTDHVAWMVVAGMIALAVTALVGAAFLLRRRYSVTRPLPTP